MATVPKVFHGLAMGLTSSLPTAVSVHPHNPAAPARVPTRDPGAKRSKLMACSDTDEEADGDSESEDVFLAAQSEKGVKAVARPPTPTSYSYKLQVSSHFRLTL